MALKRLTAAAVAAGVLALAGCKSEKGPMLRTTKVTEGPIEDKVEATGSIVPLNRVEIKPPVGGRIEQLLVDEGDQVKAGQTVAWMSSSDRAAILDAARAQGPEMLKHWQDAYKPTPVVASLSGVIILRNVVVGQTVDPGVVIYAMSDKLIALAQVDESDIGRVKMGMKANWTLDSYPDQTFPGKVFDILHEGKNVSNVITYGVKVQPDRMPPFARSQMTVTVDFVIGRKEKALLVPAVALREAPGGGKQVMVPGPEGKPEAHPVQVGIDGGDMVEIVSGLSLGDAIVLGRGRYSPQQGPQSSPLTSSGQPAQSSSNAPRSKRKGG
jgi:macrolide-specific efflux system membrane fusion protein